MTSSTQTIPEEFLDWCFKNTNISESTGKDTYGIPVKLIHFAAEKGYVQVVKKLVDSGIEVDLPYLITKWTPLHYASLNGHLEVAKLLLQKGANINCQNDRKRSPLHIASNKGHLEVVKLLLEKGANINCQDYNKWTPLHYASLDGHLEVAKVLLERGANINSQNSYRYTPLHIAASEGKKEMVKLLMDIGSDLNLKNITGDTAEKNAATNGFHEIVTMITNKRMESLSLNQNNSSKNPNECKICFDPKKDGTFAFVPCGHTVACEQCCKKILGDSCPICRRVIHQYIRIYL